MLASRHAHRAIWLTLTILTAAATALSYQSSVLRSGLLEERSPSCGNKTYNSCSGVPAFPSTFCCAPDSSCWPLAANTTVLCCPNGRDCSLISPITCDLSQQNANVYPEAQIKTLALGLQLPQCGVNCCPWGFSCNTDGNCQMEKDQSQPPPGYSTLSSVATPVAGTTVTTIKKPPPQTMTSIISVTAVPTSSSVSSSAQASTNTSSNSAIGPIETAGSGNETGNESSSSTSNSSDMSTGDKIGVSVGAGVGAIVILLAGYIAYSQHKIAKRRRGSDSAPGSAQERKVGGACHVMQMGEQGYHSQVRHSELPASEIFELHA